MRKIFVFGSNIDGIHGAGAAQAALQHHGAIRNVPMGLQGNSYAIATKDLKKGERSVPLGFIQRQIFLLCQFAVMHPDYVFMVTRIGCGHAGFFEDEIGPMFNMSICGDGESIKKPDNIILCPEFERYQSIRDTREFDPSPL